MLLKNREIAQTLLDNIGGGENILGIRECMTRIRFRLKNASLTKEEEIKRINGIIGIIEADNLYFIVLEEGLNTKVFNEILKILPGLTLDPQEKPVIEERIPEGSLIGESITVKDEKKKTGVFEKIMNMLKGNPQD